MQYCNYCLINCIKPNSMQGNKRRLFSKRNKTYICFLVKYTELINIITYTIPTTYLLVIVIFLIYRPQTSVPIFHAPVRITCRYDS